MWKGKVGCSSCAHIGFVFPWGQTGDGLCWGCEGSGVERGKWPSGQPLHEARVKHPCPLCNGTGICSVCHGEGLV